MAADEKKWKDIILNICFFQVVQLEELMAVRHSVFVLGNAGTGKSQVGCLFCAKAIQKC